MAKFSKRDNLNIILLSYLQNNIIEYTADGVPDFEHKGFSNIDIWYRLCDLAYKKFIENDQNQRIFRETSKEGREYLAILKKDKYPFGYWFIDHVLEIVVIILSVVTIYLMVK